MSTEKQEIAPDASGATADETVQPEPEDSLAAVTAERDQLQEETADLKDRLLRSRAEFENFRRRADRDRSDFLQYAGSEVVREILPVLDDFERGLKIQSADTDYQKGVELIYQRLLDTLMKIGLEPIDASTGQVFDPNVHQAVVRFEAVDAPDNTVLEEFQRGYNFKGKLLRPAMVKVAVNPSAESAAL